MSRTDKQRALVKETADDILRLINAQIGLLSLGKGDDELGVGVDLSIWRGKLVIVPRFGRLQHGEIEGGDLGIAGRAVRHLNMRSRGFKECFEVASVQNDIVLRVVQTKGYKLLQHISYS